jgi:uncharacterized membrane protein YsdA (DUF1294 family)
MVDRPPGPPWGAPPPPPPPFAPAAPVGWTPSPPPFRSLRGLGVATTVLLVLAGLVAALLVPLALHERQVVHDGSTFGAFFVDRDVRHAIDATNGLAGVYFLLFLAIAVLWMIWMWRAARNTAVLRRFAPRFGAGFAIGGWFIPLANWVIPGMHMYDIDRGSGPPAQPGERPRGSGLLVVWWITFVGGWIGSTFGQVAVRTGRRYDVSGFDTRNTIFVVGMVLTVVAAVLAILVVRSITSAQHDAWAAMGPDPSAPVAATAFAAPAAPSPRSPAPPVLPRAPQSPEPQSPPAPPPAPVEWPGRPPSDP